MNRYILFCLDVAGHNKVGCAGIYVIDPMTAMGRNCLGILGVFDDWLVQCSDFNEALKVFRAHSGRRGACKDSLFVVKFLYPSVSAGGPPLSQEDIGLLVRTLLYAHEGFHQLSNSISLTAWGKLPSPNVDSIIVAFSLAVDCAETYERLRSLLLHEEHHGLIEFCIDDATGTSDHHFHPVLVEHDLDTGDGSLLGGFASLEEVGAA